MLISAGKDTMVGNDSCDRVGEIKQSGDCRNLKGRSHCSTQSLSYRIARAFPSAVFYIRQSNISFTRKCDLALDKRLLTKIKMCPKSSLNLWRQHTFEVFFVVAGEGRTLFKQARTVTSLAAYPYLLRCSSDAVSHTCWAQENVPPATRQVHPHWVAPVPYARRFCA